MKRRKCVWVVERDGVVSTCHVKKRHAKDFVGWGRFADSTMFGEPPHKYRIMRYEEAKPKRRNVVDR